MIVTCLNDVEFDDLTRWSQLVSKLMHEFEWLINSRLIEFYNENSWSKLPKNWTTYLDSLTPYHLTQWLKNEKISADQVMPLSLICMQKVSKLFAFNRAESNLNELNDLLRKVHYLTGEIQDETPYKITDLNQIDLKSIFNRHLKVKKQHEVGRFSSLINNVLGSSKDVRLIDFGSGQGHLDRFLTIYFNYSVIALESEANNTRRAGEYDEQAIRYLSKLSKLKYHKSQNANLALNNLPRHLNIHVTNRNCNELCAENDLTYKKTSLIGLHSCGSLSTDLIKLYTQNDLGNYLFLVSCCYHKCASDKFLLSKTIRNFDYNWNYESKEIACHSIENFVDQLETDYSKLKINCYRGLLEYIFCQHFPTFRNSELSKVRKFERLNFVEYVTSATRSLEINIDEALLNNEFINDKLDNYLQVIKFYILRLLFAPMIENLIQVDRMLYLFENGIQSALIPVFNPKLSPRNFVLFAFKTRKELK